MTSEGNQNPGESAVGTYHNSKRDITMTNDDNDTDDDRLDFLKRDVDHLTTEKIPLRGLSVDMSVKYLPSTKEEMKRLSSDDREE